MLSWRYCLILFLLACLRATAHKEDKISAKALIRSVLHYGDLAMFVPLLHKLRDGNCVHVLIIGGSISAGRGLPNGAPSYPALFEQAVNEAFPCEGQHTVSNLARGGVTSDYWCVRVLRQCPYCCTA